MLITTPKSRASQFITQYLIVAMPSQRTFCPLSLFPSVQLSDSFPQHVKNSSLYTGIQRVLFKPSFLFNRRVTVGRCNFLRFAALKGLYFPSHIISPTSTGRLSLFSSLHNYSYLKSYF